MLNDTHLATLRHLLARLDEAEQEDDERCEMHTIELLERLRGEVIAEVRRIVDEPAEEPRR